MLILLSLLFVVVNVVDCATTLNRTATPCTVYYRDRTNRVQGVLFTGKNNDEKNKYPIELCCLPNVATPTVEYLSSSARASCCQQNSNSGQASHCPKLKGHRACPEYNCLGKFNQNGKNFRQLKTPPLFIACSDIYKSSDTGTIEKTDIIMYKGSQSCADKSMNILIISVKSGKQPDAYHWCCSKDITTQLDVDPKDVCCGLAGSQAPQYAGKPLSGRNATPVNLEGPRCCRKLQGESTCQFLDYSTNFQRYFPCAGVAGSVKTANLNENLPYLAPLHYFYYQDGSSPKAYEDPSKAYACDASGSKFLYSLQESTLLFGVQRLYSVPIGLCCSKDIFYSDAQKIVDDCCITYTDKGVQHADLVDNSQSKGKKAWDTSFYQCSMMNNKAKGFIDKGKFIYRPCKPDACTKIDDKFGKLENKSILKTHSVSAVKITPIYGLYEWHVDKYDKNTQN